MHERSLLNDRKSWTSINLSFQLSAFFFLPSFIYVIKIYVRSQKRVSEN